MKKLFASFSGLLGQLVDGNITEEDLASGFFMFSCTRGHALAPGEEGGMDERLHNKGRNAEVYPQLLDALLIAEAAGRAGWIRPDAHTRLRPIDVLNEMLERHGMQTMHEDKMSGQYHSLPELRDRLNEAGIPLEVIF